MDNVYKGFSFFVCLTIVTLILIATFLLRTAGLHQAIVSIYRVELYVPPWLIVIGVPQFSLLVGGFRSKALLAADRKGSVSSSQNANDALDRNTPTMSKVWDTPITLGYTIASLPRLFLAPI